MFIGVSRRVFDACYKSDKLKDKKRDGDGGRLYATLQWLMKKGDISQGICNMPPWAKKSPPILTDRGAVYGKHTKNLERVTVTP